MSLIKAEYDCGQPNKLKTKKRSFWIGAKNT